VKAFVEVAGATMEKVWFDYGLEIALAEALERGGPRLGTGSSRSGPISREELGVKDRLLGMRRR
jgi:hypothetical protein